MKHAYKEARSPASKGKQLHHLEVRKAEDGGHIVTHHYEEDGMVYHKPTEHVFGEDEGHEALQHIAKHAEIEDGGGHEPPEEPDYEHGDHGE